MARNIRDVGATLADMGCSLIKTGTLLRSGDLNHTYTQEEVMGARCILTLKRSADEEVLNDVAYLRVEAPSRSEGEKYETDKKMCRLWLREVVKCITQQSEIPVLVHCTFGRDRTGIVVALILYLCGVPSHLIKREFMLSPDAPSDLCDVMLNGFTGIDTELRKRKDVDISKLLSMFLSS